MKALRNTQVPVYFLNAEFDYRNLLDFAALDPDCLHTVIVRMGGSVIMMIIILMMMITLNDDNDENGLDD